MKINKYETCLMVLGCPIWAVGAALGHAFYYFYMGWSKGLYYFPDKDKKHTDQLVNEVAKDYEQDMRTDE